MSKPAQVAKQQNYTLYRFYEMLNELGIIIAQDDDGDVYLVTTDSTDPDKAVCLRLITTVYEDLFEDID